MYINKLVFILITLGLFYSCSYISDANLELEGQNDNLYLTADATFTDQLGITLPYVNLPIYDFEQFKHIGKLVMQGGNQVYFELNISEIFSEYTINENKLPNGNTLPFILDEDVKIYTFVLNSNSTKLYIAVDDNFAVAGLAVPLSGMNLPADSAPFEVLTGFNVKGVNGAVGTFHGEEVGQNGFLLFFNISEVMNQLDNKSFDNYTNLIIPEDIEYPSYKKIKLIQKIKKRLNNKKVELY